MKEGVSEASRTDLKTTRPHGTPDRWVPQSPFSPHSCLLCPGHSHPPNPWAQREPPPSLPHGLSRPASSCPPFPRGLVAPLSSPALSRQRAKDRRVLRKDLLSPNCRGRSFDIKKQPTTTIRALETGLPVDAFPRTSEIMGILSERSLAMPTSSKAWTHPAPRAGEVVAEGRLCQGPACAGSGAQAGPGALCGGKELPLEGDGRKDSPGNGSGRARLPLSAFPPPMPGTQPGPKQVLRDSC